ncbi:nuclear transport factor 2 family protein [Leifsonia sp. ZF2019]|uniref:nuclear transport factor 2 family protein n=1 Tax=Leifsonia sp. ZF2019 TaxID=2781978 RepID=UPI001CBDE050|nr:nuclear transport factor 2 family protein [Leifsonia sp. ZF2019]UAJ81064.1 nuclear transport factor 2 family protein [Leifsonia sp. ZF2019]
MTALDALRIVTEQVDAFNAHDLDGFVATYAEDAIVTGVGEAALTGREEIRAFYADRLAYPGLHCTIDAHTLFGDRWVVAREQVVRDGVATETIATFDVRDGLIRRASMVKA